jgi:cell division transport system ATP-binding protein
LLYLALRPSRGLIRLFARTLSPCPAPACRASAGGSAWCSRNPAGPHLSAFDNVALPLRVAGVEDADLEVPVREMLAWVGLGDRAAPGRRRFPAASSSASPLRGR